MQEAIPALKANHHALEGKTAELSQSVKRGDQRFEHYKATNQFQDIAHWVAVPGRCYGSLTRGRTSLIKPIFAYAFQCVLAVVHVTVHT